MDREVTKSINIQFTGTAPDHRIDAAFLDHFDCVHGAFGIQWQYVVRMDGTVEIGRDPRTRSSRTRSPFAHTEALHIGVVGGYNQETGERVQTTTAAQARAIEELLQSCADALNTPLEVFDGRERWASEGYRTDLEIAEGQDAELDRLEG